MAEDKHNNHQEFKPSQILKITNFFLRLVGVHPKQNKYIRWVLSTTAILALFLNLLLTLLELLLNWKGVATLSRIEYLPSNFIFLFKVIIMTTSRKKVAKILTSLMRFWPTDKFDKKSKTIADGTFNLVYKLAVTFVIFVFLNCIWAVLRALRTNQLIYKGWDLCDYETNVLCYRIQVSCQIWLMFIQAMPAALAFDFIFITCVTYIYAGSDMMAAAFRNFSLMRSNHEGDDKIAIRNLKEIVDQHNVILSFVNEVNSYCSGVLLVQFWCSLGSLIFCLYMITANGNPRPYYLVLYITFAMELLIYCIGGSLLHNKLFTIADDAFEIDWYTKNQGKLRRDLSLIIQRAQNMKSIRVGNMSDLDLVLFVAVLKNSLSIYTLINQLS